MELSTTHSGSAIRLHGHFHTVLLKWELEGAAGPAPELCSGSSWTQRCREYCHCSEVRLRHNGIVFQNCPMHGSLTTLVFFFSKGSRECTDLPLALGRDLGRIKHKDPKL